MAEEVDITLEKIKKLVEDISKRMVDGDQSGSQTTSLIVQNVLPETIKRTIAAVRSKADGSSGMPSVKNAGSQTISPIKSSAIGEGKSDPSASLQLAALNKIADILTKQKDAESGTVTPSMTNMNLPQKAVAGMRDDRRRGFLGRMFDRDSGWFGDANKHYNYGDPESMIGRGEKLINRGGRWEQTGRMMAGAGGMMKGMQDQSELSGAGSFLGGLGKMAGGIPVVGKPLEAATKFADVLFKSVDRLKKWNEQLHEGNMQFAEFSGSMAQVQVEQMQRDIKLSQERGERRADSARYLAEGKSGLQQRTSKVEDFFANMKNYVGGFLSKFTTNLIDMLTLNSLKGESAKGGGELNINEWVEYTARTAWYESYGRPKRWQDDPWDPRNQFKQ